MMKNILIGVPDFCLGIYWTLLATFIPWIIQLHNQDSKYLTLAFSLYAILGVITQIVVGYLSDKTKSKTGKRSPWIITGIIIAGISQICWGLAGGYLFLLMVSAVTVIAVNVFQCAYYSLILESSRLEKINISIGSARTFNCLGGAMMSSIAAYLWINHSLPINYCIIAALIVIPTLTIIPFIIKEKPAQASCQIINFTHTRCNNTFVLVILCLITLIAYIGSTLTIHLANTYFINNIGFSKSQLGNGLLFMNIGTLIFGLLSYKLMRNFNQYAHILFLALIIMAISFMFVSIFIKSSAHNYELYLFYFIYGSSNVSITIAVFAILANTSGLNKIGTNIGWLNVFSATGQIIGVNVFTYFIHIGNAQLTFIICSLLFIFSGGLSLLLKLTVTTASTAVKTVEAPVLNWQNTQKTCQVM